MNVPKRGFIYRNKHGVHLVKRGEDECFCLYLLRRGSGWNALRRLNATQVKQYHRRKMPDCQAEFYFRKAEELK